VFPEERPASVEAQRREHVWRETDVRKGRREAIQTVVRPKSPQAQWALYSEQDGSHWKVLTTRNVSCHVETSEEAMGDVAQTRWQ
jgi:hypothetical protein